jgi:hypothetical protein
MKYTKFLELLTMFVVLSIMIPYGAITVAATTDENDHLVDNQVPGDNFAEMELKYTRGNDGNPDLIDGFELTRPINILQMEGAKTIDVNGENNQQGGIEFTAAYLTLADKKIAAKSTAEFELDEADKIQIDDQGRISLGDKTPGI